MNKKEPLSSWAKGKGKMKEYTPLKGKKINVAGLSFKVVYFKKVEALPIGEEDQDHFDSQAWVSGWSDLTERKLGLFAYLTKEEHDYTLFHEILHCAIEAIKTGEKWQDDDFVKPLSRISFDLMRQCRMVKRARRS